MSTNKASYGASMEALTITLTAVGNNTYRSSLKVNNETTKYLDLLLEMTFGLGGVPTGDLEIYLAGSGDGTVFGGGVTGANEAPTVAAPEHLTFLGIFKMPAAGPYTVVWESVIGKVAGLAIPNYWTIVVRNLSGQTITSGSIRWKGQQISEE